MTTAKSTQCPSDETLTAWRSKQLPADLTALIGGHVDTCATCQGRLASTVSGQADTATQVAKGPAADARPATDDKATKGPDQPTLAFDGAAGADAEYDDHYKFLSPAQAAGELGRLGQFRILRVMGQGGMGVVFEAEDSSLDRRVALKCLRPEVASSAIRKRFLQEARIAASLPHEHIVTIYQVGEENNVPYYAMECLRGESVHDRLNREGWLPIGEALRIAREAAEGLQAAHSRGLIHRDVKPANVWLEFDQPGAPIRRVCLLDFGIARAMDTDEQLTQLGHIVGTPSYMSPEQAAGNPVDARSDLFSLGCMLYRMLTGRAPFVGEDTVGVLSAIIKHRITPSRGAAPEIPAPVALLLNSLLAHDPQDRPATAAAVVEQIRALEKNPECTPLDVGLRTTLNITAMRRAIQPRRFRWGMWGGAASIMAAVLLGAFVQYRNFIGVKSHHASKQMAVADHVPSGGDHAQLDANTAKPEGAPLPVAPRPQGPPIRVGVLHSLTGTMAANETPLAEAVELAIDEINEAGGVLGRPVEAIVYDGQSQDAVFAAGAEHLITRDKVCAIFGCWTSSSRKNVKPVVEKHNSVLFYPVQSEGLELSKNIIYLGACPNQQLLPAVKWSFAFLDKRRFFLIGSDYVFPHAANAIIKDELARLGGEVVGEEYIPLGTTDLAVVDKIVAAKPDVILNTINGDNNTAFIRRLRQSGIRADETPTISFSLTENGLRSLRAEEAAGDYVAWSYFESLISPVNESFLTRFRKRFGRTRAVTDPMEISYCGVHLWKQGVESAHSTEAAQARVALLGHAYDAPEGRIRVDGDTQYTWRTPRIGKITLERDFDEVWSSPRAIAPEPFPNTRAREAWEKYLTDLYNGWDQHWHNPASQPGGA